MILGRRGLSPAHMELTSSQRVTSRVARFFAREWFRVERGLLTVAKCPVQARCTRGALVLGHQAEADVVALTQPHASQANIMELKMKIIAILALLATAFVALPAQAYPGCSGTPDEPNNQSSLSSTSAGTQVCYGPLTHGL